MPINDDTNRQENAAQYAINHNKIPCFPSCCLVCFEQNETGSFPAECYLFI